MLGLIQDFQLTIEAILRHGELMHGTGLVLPDCG